METHQKGLLQGTFFAAAVAAFISVATTLTPKTPIRTSILTGQRWLTELYSSPVRMHEQLGMAKHVFHKLCTELKLQHGLSDSRHIWSCLDKCPNLTFSACTRLISSFLLFLEDTHDDHIISVCPAAACSVVRCSVFGAFWGHIIVRVKRGILI